MKTIKCVHLIGSDMQFFQDFQEQKTSKDCKTEVLPDN